MPFIQKDLGHKHVIFLKEGLDVCISPSHENIACCTCDAVVKSAMKKKQTNARYPILSLFEKFNTSLENTRQKYSVYRSHASNPKSEFGAVKRRYCSVQGHQGKYLCSHSRKRQEKCWKYLPSR